MFWHFGFLLPVMLFARFFWLLIILLLLGALARRLFVKRWQCSSNRPLTYPYHGSSPVQGSALEILRQRYARGEIDGTTFDQMRERLEASERSGQQN